MKFVLTARGGWRSSPFQSGAATLVIVMALFLIVGLLAAYANRSILFEQRMAGSYYQGALAKEVAEAGSEWTLAMLNSGKVDSACQPSTSGTRLIDLYIPVAPDSRIMSPTYRRRADCYRNGSEGWVCRCPEAGSYSDQPVQSEADYFQPSFVVSFAPARRPGTFLVETRACTSSSITTCIRPDDVITNRQAVATIQTAVGFVSAVRSPPSVPLTVKGALVVNGSGLGLHNSDPRTAGMLAVTGGTQSGLADSRLESLPGTPISAALLPRDAALLGGEVFRMFMGARPERYVNHPAKRDVACSSDCASDLSAAYAAGQRILWINGDLTLATSLDIGTVDDPVVVIATGNVNVTGALKYTGLLVARGNFNWNAAAASTSLLTGSLLVEGDMTTSGTMDVYYLQSVTDRLRNTVGSFVRVPGSWFDAQLR